MKKLISMTMTPPPTAPSHITQGMVSLASNSRSLRSATTLDLVARNSLSTSASAALVAGSIWAKTRSISPMARRAFMLPTRSVPSVGHSSRMTASAYPRISLLTVSIGTGKTHVKSILEKLQAVGRTQAVTIAQERGLLAPQTGVLRRMPTLRGQNLIYGKQMHRKEPRDGVPVLEVP